jgi:hypothetical protein
MISAPVSSAICLILRAIISSSLPGEGEAYLDVIPVDDEADGPLAALGPHPNQELSEGTRLASDRILGGIALDDDGLVEQELTALVVVAPDAFASRVGGQLQNS